MTSQTCSHCDNPAEYWTCCGNPADGSSGTTCDHDGGERVCETCWERLEQDGDVSSASDSQRVGWIACDYTQGDTPETIAHGPIRATAAEARADVSDGYEGVRYLHTDGYLYVDAQE